MPPRVTVITPTYNWSAVLRCAVASVLGQTFSDFEYLVVGDCCTDDSEQVVGAFRDPRLRWINMPARTGHQTGPNNEALREAKGEVIAYLGHDDLWLPHHLDAVVGALDASASDLAYGLGINVVPDDSFWPTLPAPERGSFSSPLSMVHRRRVTDTIGGWRHYRELTTSPDVELWRRAQARGCVMTFVPRLTGIKFPASWRRGVYLTRPSQQQEAWLRRIQSEPDLETRLLVQLILGDGAISGRPYGELVGGVLRETTRRIRRRLTLPRLGMTENLDVLRRFKGAGEDTDA